MIGHTTTTTVEAASLRSGSRAQDAAFRRLVKGAGIGVLVLTGAIGVFLAGRATPAFRGAGWHFFTETEWFPDAVPSHFGIAALAFGTVVSSLVALVVATPVAVGTALFLTEVAPRRLGTILGYLVDLLAAVPSVVFGLWGLVYLAPRMVGFQRGLDDLLGWVPIFHSRTGAYGRSILVAGVVLAIMILPIIAAIARELFRQVPRANKEAALALGATRWEVIRLAVVPHGRSGLVGAAMLGLGRALGETIAVALVLPASFTINPHLVEPAGNSIAANIAVKFGEAGSTGRSALIASGLVLFAITFGVNALARGVAHRSLEAAEAHP